MRTRLVLASLVGATAFVPALSADAYICTPGNTVAGVKAQFCTEGLLAVPGGYTTASRVEVTVNGGTMRWCIARTTVTTGGVEHDWRTIYPC